MLNALLYYSIYFIFRQQKYFQKSHHLLSVIITCIFLHNCRHSGGCLREYFLCIICHICTKRYLENILSKHLSSAKKRLSILHIIRLSPIKRCNRIDIYLLLKVPILMNMYFCNSNSLCIIKEKFK